MATFNLALLPGDGIGPEVIQEAQNVLAALARRFRHDFHYIEDTVGGAAIDRFGVALRPETLTLCKKQDAVLFGAVGGPKWDDPKALVRPEQAILGLRKGLGLFANLRPVRLYPFLAGQTALKPEVVDGVDLLILRELTGGIYFGKPQRRWTTARGRRAVDTCRYTEQEIARIVRLAFELARGRRKKVTSVDKANVLDTSRLWREVATEVGRDYPDVQLEHLLVDSCAMHLIRRPTDFDVIVTENLFGDILTDEASMLAGSMGMLPSASLGARRRGRSRRVFGLYEPIHGSAPDIAGKGKANPVAAILSAALLLRHSLGLEREAAAIEAAVERVLRDGARTADLAPPGAPSLSTSEMGARIAAALAG